MAFVDQVQDLCSLTVADNDEFSQFLRDGVIDVTNRCLAVKPQEVEDFQRESDEVTSQAGIDLGGATITSVVRESGTDNDWRSCSKISPSMQSRVVDTDSLSFASKFNPVYMVGDNNKISVFPAPGSNPNAYKVYYVNNVPVDETNETTLVHSDNDIKYFPASKVYLVIYYAAMKLLQATMGAKTVPTVPTLLDMPVTLANAATTYTDAVISAATEIDVDSFNAPPVFIKPTIAGTANELTDITALDGDNTIDDFDGNAIELDQWFATLAHLIEDEEDPELAQLQLQKIQAYTSSFQTELGYQKEVFNQQNATFQADVQKQLAEYQADIQIRMQTADATTKLDLQNKAKAFEVVSTNYNLALQNYKSQIESYSANASGSLQKYAASIQGSTLDYQWLESQYSKIKGDYDAAFLLMSPRQKN